MAYISQSQQYSERSQPQQSETNQIIQLNGLNQQGTGFSSLQPNSFLAIGSNKIDLINDSGIIQSSQASYFAPLKYDNVETNSVDYKKIHSRFCKDSIYTERIEFTLDLWKYIDNPIFARLKNMYQLGTLYHVFPGATHTRFSHSLGVGHLAQKQMHFLFDIRRQLGKGYTQNHGEYTLDQKDVRNVTMAGLMHDLGHGPFSHLFDKGVIPTLLRQSGRSWDSIQNWEHENASEMLFDYMIEKCNIDIDEDELDKNMICRLIQGRANENSDQDKKWMFEIVANKRNSFDVDKLDYLSRDNYHCGLNQQQGHQDYINFETIIKNSRVVKNQLAYNIKIVNSIKMVYDLRFEMFRAIYTHKAAQAIDLMFQDVLVKANPSFDFLNNLQFPQKYVQYTDMIINRIKRSKDPLLKESQEIIDRIQKRNLYQYVDGFFLDEWRWKEQFKAQDVVGFSQTGTLKVEDIILLPTKYDYGCGTNFPIDQMTFYSSDLNLEIIEKINDFEYGLSKPIRNQEPYMRIFVRDPKKYEDAQVAFQRYCKQFESPDFLETFRCKREKQHYGEIEHLQMIHNRSASASATVINQSIKNHMLSVTVPDPEGLETVPKRLTCELEVLAELGSRSGQYGYSMEVQGSKPTIQTFQLDLEESELSELDLKRQKLD